MSNCTIRIVLHGGLGNQLFQYFVGRLEAKRRSATRLALVPDLLAQYGAARELELAPLIDGEPEGLVCIVPANRLDRLRVPKVIWRLTRREIILRLPGRGATIDGYFQWVSSYGIYPSQAFREVIGSWRSVLSTTHILLQPQHERVTHIRLGDFFRSEAQARAFARQRLKALTSPTDLVTDGEKILGDELARLALPFDVKIVPTAELSAWELLSLLSGYKRIDTNGSSLAFWAAVLSRAELVTSNSDHEAIWRLLTRPD